jgi:hypothetical protein
MFAEFDTELPGAGQKQITAKDPHGLEATYRAAIGGCNGCIPHKKGRSSASRCPQECMRR